MYEILSQNLISEYEHVCQYTSSELYFFNKSQYTGNLYYRTTLN